MSISSVSSVSTTSSNNTTSSSSSSGALDTEQFLSLLVSQLQNQDPLDPTDTSEIMNQMVSFASYQQTANSSATLESISSTLDAIASSLDISV